MNQQKLLLQGVIAIFVCTLFFSGCFLFEDEEPTPDPGISVATIPLNSKGATHLLAYDEKIFIGHITYAGTGPGAGFLQYYDPVSGLINTTGITEIDMAKLVYDDESGRIYFINGVNTFYIDTSAEITSWSAIAVTGGPAPGADMVLYKGNIYVLYTDYFSLCNMYCM